MINQPNVKETVAGEIKIQTRALSETKAVIWAE